MMRSKETGRWLTNLPNTLNGTVLSEEEFRDSLRLRFGLTPLKLPSNCDGCGKKFDFNHAQQICKKGGLITHRHDDVAAAWSEFCARALKPSAVSHEPYIHTGRDTLKKAGVADTSIEKDMRGDVRVHGFWTKQQSTIFDVRITDADCKTEVDRDPRKVLAQHERAKKKTYLVLCTDQWRHFTPLVFSVDGMVGVEAQAAIKRLASLLSVKWKRPYSEICAYVRSGISISLVRTASGHYPTARVSHATWETGADLSLYH